MLLPIKECRHLTLAESVIGVRKVVAIATAITEVPAPINEKQLHLHELKGLNWR